MPQMRSASDLLRAAGLRRTPARLSVLDRIEALARPLSHGELLALPELGALDDITLYRTLATLVEVGLVHRVHGIDGTWRYCAQPRDIQGCPGNHAHFLCTTCGAMTCLLTQPMPRVVVPPGVEVEGRHFLVHGRCAACVSASVPHSGESA
jgi:Fur family ferric uptake transcriptional regulator/Fur family zinc uptake transcriptional regulator